MLNALKLNTKLARVARSGLLMTTLCALQTGSAYALLNSDSRIENHAAIPHSVIAQANGAGVVKAMLSCATDRYTHGVLGDTIEAGCLIVEDEFGIVFQLDLPDHQVFEDLIPRIADMDADGQNDVVLVRSDLESGAAVSIYSLNGSGAEKSLLELAATPTIGTANRWLAPVGIADFNGDGVLDIAYIQTPHLAGTLKVWSIVDERFLQIAESYGYSNHQIGATRVSTSKLKDFNNDGLMDMALPDQNLESTIWLTLYPEFSVLDTKPYALEHFN